MLTKEELRIGNYIIGKDINYRDVYKQVLDFTDRGIAVDHYREVTTTKGFEIGEGIDRKHVLPWGWANGIPISEAWMEALGLIGLDSGGFKYKSWTLFFNYDRPGVLRGKFYFGSPIQYVHQLQNIIFEMDNELLEVLPGKLPKMPEPKEFRPTWMPNESRIGWIYS